MRYGCPALLLRCAVLLVPAAARLARTGGHTRLTTPAPHPQDRFGFEWNQRGQHPTVEAWAEAVRDDWTKFMHKVNWVGTASVCLCM